MTGKETNDRECHFGRVLVTYHKQDRKLVCECRKKACQRSRQQFTAEYKNAGLLKTSDCEPLKRTVDPLLIEEALYLYNNKKVPFHDSCDIEENRSQMFQMCSKCVPNARFRCECRLKQLTLFFLYRREGYMYKSCIGVCPQCKLQYRPQDYTSCFHNYNKSSFFSIKLMEDLLNS